ncbi:hypothetical protein M2360_004344 [Rhizobium sp. SG_E_25_P2]|jgi:hypothetical protein|uniref:hypothetical protein n=1 Tax=Rhizobium sp. SG_E_25_P2 TaxID=2879942 RepID=UPI002473F929|nr:hypothetical protein [Rhizobium sp. SG_E_25_P2]MDH6268925.1 hypothetical protein [Rhizobium sp. SG_E_25_P2]
MVDTPSQPPKGQADNVVNLEVYRLRREARRIRGRGFEPPPPPPEADPSPPAEGQRQD